ncbi:hypothetical protein B0O80DRAFT_258665 [Mortierella sp. GBAus27b]|nr:hypothetical protein B0O80DRAFT_258665 [Mortierella sp. GBAus27b]
MASMWRGRFLIARASFLTLRARWGSTALKHFFPTLPPPASQTHLPWSTGSTHHRNSKDRTLKNRSRDQFGHELGPSLRKVAGVNVTDTMREDRGRGESVCEGEEEEGEEEEKARKRVLWEEEKRVFGALNY